MKSRKNKGYKIENYGRIFDGSDRRRKKRIRNTVIFVLVVLLLVFVGYSISGPLKNLLKGEKTDRGENVSSQITSSEVVSSSVALPEKDSLLKIDKVAYLPISTALNDDALNSYLDKIKAQGYNAVVLELKDEKGSIYYNTKNEMALSVDALNESVLPDISKTLKSIEDKGFSAIVNIHAFKDMTATKNADAKIKYMGQPGWSWFDAANGKPWLNPYSSVAQQYIIDLATELSMLGVKNIMVSSVMFPSVKNFYQADFGELEKTVSHKDILLSFSDTLKKAVNQNGAKLYLRYNSVEAENTANVIYGGENPLKFSADVYVPQLTLPQDSGLKLSEFLLNVKTAYPEHKLMPEISVNDVNGVRFTNEQINLLKQNSRDYPIYVFDVTASYN